MVSASRSLSETVRGAKNNWVNSTATATLRQNAKIRLMARERARLRRRMPAAQVHPRNARGIYRTILAIQSAREATPRFR